ncbi:DUF3696 domain-containing protein [bacterium]|nr:DUF3696 domain-containing protein [bacterium]
MIDRLHFESLKCFSSLSIELSNLTLLTGANSAGKSTIIQSLLLLHQTMRENEWSKRVLLNGTVVKLGTVAEVVNNVAGRLSFGLGVCSGRNTIKWTFEGDVRSEMSMKVREFLVNNNVQQSLARLYYLVPEDVPSEIRQIASSIRGLDYISAERIGPRGLYSLADKNTISTVGARGEFAPSLLFQRQGEPVPSHLALPDVPNTLLKQVQARLGILFPGCELSISEVKGANYVLLQFRNSPANNFHSTINVGFGMTQVFPIIVAGLVAEEQHLMIVENPEVHLHPLGQSYIGRFLAEISASGNQVIVESHSDHVLNGIRLAASDKKVDAKDVCIQYFRLPDESDKRQNISIKLDSDGRLDVWPNGFFDQIEKDLTKLR